MCALLKENAAFVAAAQKGSPVLSGNVNNQVFAVAVFSGGYAPYWALDGAGVFLSGNPPATVVLPQIHVPVGGSFACGNLSAIPKAEKRAEGMAVEKHSEFYAFLKANKSDKTAQGYFYDVRNVLTAISKNSFGNLPLDKLNLARISLEHVKQTEKELFKNSEFKPKTLERMKQGWNRFCHFLDMPHWKFEVKTNATEAYKNDVISTDAVHKMLKYCQQQREVAGSDAEIIRWYRKEIAIRLGFEMGFRSCEYGNATFDEVEKENRITIKHSKAEGSREVSIMRATKAVILEFKAFLEERNMYPASGGVFERSDGENYSTSSFRRWMKQTAEACGIPVRLAQTHGLRHRYAKNFYSHTHDIVMLARLMGHKSTKTTRQYAEPTFENVQEAMQSAVDAAYGSLAQVA